VRAVNLIPSDSRQRFAAPSRSGGLAYVVLGLLAAAVVLSTVYVLSANTISDRQAKIGRLQRQASVERALAARLAPYTEFAQLAQSRTSTVHEIAASRFDWHTALAQLAQVVPANTSLQSLVGTVAPGAGSGATGGGQSDLRPDITTPALELAGCTRTQDDVAQLISRLRLMSGVTRVSLESSTKSGSGQAGTSAGGSGGGCPANSPSFNLVVWYKALPGAGADGYAPAGSTGSTGAPAATSSTPSKSTPAGAAATTKPAAQTATTSTGGKG
jgi:Tfp pilus assembly protein PilN